jgi:hypothetical protein
MGAGGGNNDGENGTLNRTAGAKGGKNGGGSEDRRGVQHTQIKRIRIGNDCLAIFSSRILISEVPLIIADETEGGVLKTGKDLYWLSMYELCTKHKN